MASQISSDAVRVMPDVLRAMTVEILCRVGVRDADAACIADCLVQVDQRGVFSHGTRQLRRYVPEFRDGRINPAPDVRLVREMAVTSVHNGDGGAGYLAAVRATEAVVQKAGVQGIAISSTRNHGHVGSLGIYARMALCHDLVSFSVAGACNWQPPAEPDATVWDAMKSPPMCLAVPASEGPPLVLDMSANMFRQQDELEEMVRRFPEPVLKSLGLKFAATLLGGVLAGMASSEEHDPAFSAAVRGFLIVAFRPDAAGDGDGFVREVTRIITASRALKPMPGYETAELPGSLEWQRERDWARDGIPLSAAHRETLETVAESVGVGVPW